MSRRRGPGPPGTAGESGSDQDPEPGLTCLGRQLYLLLGKRPPAQGHGLVHLGHGHHHDVGHGLLGLLHQAAKPLLDSLHKPQLGPCGRPVCQAGTVLIFCLITT